MVGYDNQHKCHAFSYEFYSVKTLVSNLKLKIKGLMPDARCQEHAFGGDTTLPIAPFPYTTNPVYMKTNLKRRTYCPTFT